MQAGARTPAHLASTRRTPGDAPLTSAPYVDHDVWDSDSETGDTLGMSPPKTMQFHVPTSRLLQTPAREASKRIVEDLLLTAGAGASVTDELAGLDLELDLDLDLDLDGWEEDERGAGARRMADDDSPSIVRTARREMLDDDTF